MKPIIFYILIVISVTSFAQNSNWKTEINIGNNFSVTSLLHYTTKNKEFYISTPKNADIRTYGFFKAILGRILGKSPKKGILLSIKGVRKGDSLIGRVVSSYLKNYHFKALMHKNSFNGVLTINDTVTGIKLSGVKTQMERLDYSFLYPKIITVTRQNIFSKKIIEGKAWQKFEKKLKKVCQKSYDDIELFMGFERIKKKLQFSHYSLVFTKQSLAEMMKSNSQKKSVIFEEKNERTGYIKILNFSSSKEELSEIFPQIIQKNYKNLIIDLRDNGGGGIEAAFEFAKHIINKSVKVGYFVTNRLNYSGFDAQLFNSLPDKIPETTIEFINYLKTSKGVILGFHKSDLPVYSGRIYVLTNRHTASTCEPIVYMLKKYKRAIIIGENTAGAMLSATIFDIQGKYKLYMPIADFYTIDGVHLEKKGVSPDIKTESEQALNKALEIILENEN